MTARINHRGPDDQGLWSDHAAGIALGHRRLAVIDLSPAGFEPMHSASGRFTISFNGEIYNYQDLRDVLESGGEAPKTGWRGHSDVEVFLEALERWGIERALSAAVGMFAFALWDNKERKLCLVRDRFGEKPLYYGWAGRDLVFASELKSLVAHPRFERLLNRDALDAYLRHNYVPAPASIYRHAFKLQPGTILTLAPGVGQMAEAPAVGEAGKHWSLDAYYDYRATVSKGAADSFSDHGEALDALEDVLERAVGDQAVADVPVGAFLSGGIDSSTITALYQRQTAHPVRTFSIGFNEDRYNEAVHAKRVAAHLGTVHDELYVTDAQAREVIPLLPDMYDEPFADSSQIPTFIVSRFARQQVTVALTGDGGDEMFAGYNRHLLVPRWRRRLSRLPSVLRRPGGALAARVPGRLVELAARSIGASDPRQAAAKMRKGLALAAGAKSLPAVLEGLLDNWALRGDIVDDADSRHEPDLDFGAATGEAEKLAAYDALTYLPDDILAKVDRASMAVGLETRVPFLDHRVAAVAARIPGHMKIRGGKGKVILRDLLSRHVPQELLDRPKAGFAVPVSQWLQGPLRDWAEDLLSPTALAEAGVLNVKAIRNRWLAHARGSEDAANAIWAVLMFQAWRREWNPTI